MADGSDTPESTADRLTALAQRLEVDPTALAGLVTALHNNRASTINDNGPAAQISYLLEHLPEQGLEEALQRLASDDARPPAAARPSRVRINLDGRTTVPEAAEDEQDGEKAEPSATGAALLAGAPAWPTEDNTQAAERIPAEESPSPDDSPSASRAVRAAGSAGGTAAPAETAEPEPPMYEDPARREYVLLGSLVHSPSTLSQLGTFLGTRDFVDDETRALWETLRFLHQRGELTDARAVHDPDDRTRKIYGNQQRVFEALRTNEASTIVVPGPRLATLLDRLNVAAPPGAAATNGVHHPRSQLHLGRAVLEGAIRRNLEGLGVLMRRATPVAPSAAPLSGNRGQDRAQAAVDNLAVVKARLDSISSRFAQAVQLSPDPSDTTAARPPAATQTAQRSAVTPWRRFSRTHRAERHLLHLAMHSHDLNALPPEIRALSSDDFGDPRHAVTWQAIQGVQRRGLPIHWETVASELQQSAIFGSPGLDTRALQAMADKPVTDNGKIARSLGIVADASLSRFRDQAATATAAAAQAGPVSEALEQARGAAENLGRHTTTTRTRHQTAAAMKHPKSVSVATSTVSPIARPATP
jgi:hypothetical protein